MFSSLLGLCLSLPATAAPSIGWSELREKALSSHPEIRRSQQLEEAAEAQKTISQSGYWPSVSLFADRTKSRTDTNVLGVSTISDTTTDSDGVKVRWNLFSGFSTTGVVNQAAAQVEGARAGIQQSSMEARSALRRAYDTAVVAKESVQVYEQIRARYREQVRVISAKYKSGLEARWALDLAEANQALVEVQLKEETEGLKKALDQISILLGETVSDVTPDERSRNGRGPALEKFNLKAHPQLRQAAAERVVGEGEVLAARSTFWPSLDLSWQTGRSRLENQDPTTQTSYSLTLTYPLFSGLAGVSDVYRTRARLKAAEIREDLLARQISQTEDQARRDLAVEQERLAAQTLQLKGARAYAETTSIQYRLGGRRFSDWDTAQSRLLQAERDFLNARLRVLNGLTDWERAQGWGLEKP